ncbi:excinuclease ABC subunit UvrA [Kribbella sp. NPDC051770]|uniref:excinuclease ABC subunit UvrA n=1 Tax=Kribbella sp. NPDC051770 TaxID=3155413 RepID=UPI00342D332E
MRWGEQVSVRGARVHNLKDVDVDVPLRQLVGLTGVSGSGKSSLALGVLYAEGSRRYLEALSTYTRRRLSQAARADVDAVDGVPAAIALHQRPGVPGVRSTFGTATELLNALRLMYSRLGVHRCPSGHPVPPTIEIASTGFATCPVDGERFAAPGAEEFAFNSDGACPTCSGTGETRQIDQRSLVPDESLSIAQGAVAAWGSFGAGLLPQVVAQLGVRTDVPFRDLTPAERETVLHGEETSRVVVVASKKGNAFELNATYRNANRVIEDALGNAQSETAVTRLDRFVHVAECPTCGGSRLNERARSVPLNGVTLDVISTWPLDRTTEFVRALPAALTPELRRMAEQIVEAFTANADHLLGLGLGYLSLGRASRTLSTGELQRVQLSRTLRSSATGLLYVLDEPSIGLHPSNIDALMQVARRLIETGNSVVLVDHDVRVLRHADWLIEIGPGAGSQGGQVVATGKVPELEAAGGSLIGGFLSGREPAVVRPRVDDVFEHGRIHLETGPRFTLHPLDVDFPLQRLTAVTGVSGSGKTTLVLESLAAAIGARHDDRPLPTHVRQLKADEIERVVVVDATPIGRNVRSTVATYSNLLDDLRRAFARETTEYAAADFSYNTGSLRCPQCEGTGQISLDVQFLPDVEIPCPLCGGTRYSAEADQVTLDGMTIAQTLALTVAEARQHFPKLRKLQARLRTLDEVGLGYLILGEATPALSGGEAQRLKLVADLEKPQRGTLFVFDEPSVGLHPADIRVLLTVLDRLIAAGATVIVIEHDTDLIANADHVIDLGPGGGDQGGRIVAATTPQRLHEFPESVTGRYVDH